MRRAVTPLLAALAMLALAAPASAHRRTTVSVLNPQPGARVEQSFVVALTAFGGDAAAEVRVLIDDKLVDSDGTVGSGSLFTTFRVVPGGMTRIPISGLEPGQHILRIEYIADVDDPKPELVRPFTVVGDPDDGVPRLLVLIGSAVGLLVIAFLANLRRRAR